MVLPEATNVLTALTRGLHRYHCQHFIKCCFTELFSETKHKKLIEPVFKAEENKLIKKSLVEPCETFRIQLQI